MPDSESSPHSSHRMFQRMVRRISRNKEPRKSFQHTQPTRESIESISKEEQQESPKEIPLRAGSSDFPRVESRRALIHEDFSQEAPYFNASNVARNSSQLSDNLQTLVEVLLELQKQSSSQPRPNVRYHCIKEEELGNGKTRITVLFSPTLLIDNSSKGICMELSELLLRSYLLSRQRAVNLSEFSPGEAPPSELNTTNEMNIAPDSSRINQNDKEDLPKRRSLWTPAHSKEIEQKLKNPEPQFSIPSWLQFTSKNLDSARSNEEEVMEVTTSSVQKFEILQTQELLWVYRRFFTSLHDKIKSKYPGVVGKKLKYSQMTPPWLRRKAKVFQRIEYLPKPVRVLTLREARSKHGLRVMRIILASFYDREKFLHATL